MNKLGFQHNHSVVLGRDKKMHAPLFQGVEFYKIKNARFKNPQYQINISNHGAMPLDEVSIKTNIDAVQKQWTEHSKTLKTFLINYDKSGRHPTEKDVRDTLKQILQELTNTMPKKLQDELLKAVKRGLYTLYLPQNKSQLTHSAELPNGKNPFEIRLHARQKKLGYIDSSRPKQL